MEERAMGRTDPKGRGRGPLRVMEKEQPQSRRRTRRVGQERKGEAVAKRSGEVSEMRLENASLNL